MLTIAKIAVENAAYSFDKAFDYCVPEELCGQIQPGCRVLVPFGNGNRTRQGVVFELVRCEVDAQKRKSVTAVLDEAPLLSNEAISLAVWLKEQTFCTLFEAARLLLPAGIAWKLKTQYTLARPFSEYESERLSEREAQVLQLLSHAKKPLTAERICQDLELQEPILRRMTSKGLLAERTSVARQIGDATKKMARLAGEIPEKLTAKQQAVCRVLQDAGTASVRELCYFTGVTPAVVNTLEKRNVLVTFDQEMFRNPYEHAAQSVEPPILTLSQEQQQAFDGLLRQYHENKGGAALLFGVTGSGKTSVFMRLIDEVSSQGRGVIVMVPEISLTPQTISLFHRRYGDKVAVFHSGLTLGERMDEWKRVRRGQAQIAIGTRSAVFAPFENLGLVILDEEQEYTYKSEASPRYHARDVARFRCAWHKALLILSSATPSVESFYAAQAGRYALYELTERFGEARLPQVTIADLNLEWERGNTTLFSEPLLRGLEENLEKGRQSILLLNRRGYHTFASCKACGEVLTCPNCSISLTYHAANQRLMCHYCGYSIVFTQSCPHCGEDRVFYSGFGTQRAQEQLSELFPQARVLRLDADAAMTRLDYEEKLSRFSRGEYDMIVGTQMVAKGLDFENVTLVGVLCADQSLYSDDFRSYEHAFDLLTQVAGRAGRGRLCGRAIVQTYTPENPVIRLAANQDYRSFYRDEIALRRAMLYPPFADICVVGFVGIHQAKVQRASVCFLELLTKCAQTEYQGIPLRVLDPTPAGVPKVGGKYRYKLVVKCRNGKPFRQMLSGLLRQFAGLREFSGVTAFADMNPDTIL